MIPDNYKFVVVGGGTAGWLSALFLKKNIPKAHITVIESSDIGILGAGEGTVWNFIEFLQSIDISPGDIVYHAQGTFKNGIKFTNWNGDGEHYFHGFADPSEVTIEHPKMPFFDFSLPHLEALAAGKNLDDVNFSAQVSSNNDVKYKTNGKKTSDPYEHFTQLGHTALHFDARLLAQYLKNVGVSRGIELIDAKVTSVAEDVSHNISDIQLDNGTVLHPDFVFDCSGFHKLILGKHYQEQWESYENHLPVNRALPFFLPRTEEKIPPYTEAIAMKYGWIWKIPVGERYGCGYVFNGRLITDEQAKQEIEELVGHEITSPKTFSFTPGAFYRPWRHNVLAMGLAANFIEPLEATSIWVTTMSLRMFVKYFQGYLTKNFSHVDSYNNEVRNINQEICAFIYFHYLTKRDDTDFWRNFRVNNTPPEKYHLLHTELTSGRFERKYFGVSSYMQVGAGIKYFEPLEANQMYEYQLGIFGADKYKNDKLFKNFEMEKLTTECVDHAFITEYIKKRHLEVLKES